MIANTTHRTFRNNLSKGFSLMEMLIVIALIGLVTGLLISKFSNILGSNQESLAATFVNQSIEAPLLAYKFDIGTYPSTEEGLKALYIAPEGKANRWKGPYIKNVPLDPWNNEYQYKYPGTKNPRSFDAWTMGPDGIISEDDIGNWN